MNYLIGVIIFLSVFIGGISNADSLSLRDKIAQMLLIGFEGKQVDEKSDISRTINHDNIGGVILFDYNHETKRFDKNIESPAQVHQLIHSLQQINELAQYKQHRSLLPLFIAVDYEGGSVNRLKSSYGFPETVSAAIVGQMDSLQATQVAESMAFTLVDAGFNLNFAPVLDVNVNPDCPIIGKRERSFSANPSEVTTYASIYSNTFVNNKIQCAYKHFPGHGSSAKDSHLGFVDVSDTWLPKELMPYEQLLGKEGSCGMVMTAHLVNRQLDPSGLPATLSHKILTDLLRKKLKFNGVIITDDMQMKAITENYSLAQAITLAVNAGADMLMFGNQLTHESQDPEELIDLIEAKVNASEISEERINEAYHRIIFMKEMMK